MSNNSTCPRCNSCFFIAYVEPVVRCPFCAYSYQPAESAKIRKDHRSTIEKSCKLSRGDEILAAHTVDMSRTGVGVRAKDKAPFGIADILRVFVEGAKEDSAAKVVWLKQINGGPTRAGLKFI